MDDQTVMERRAEIPDTLHLSEFIQYFVEREREENGDDCYPSMQDLSRELGIGQGKLREQLEVAKAFGLISVQPRTGIECLGYSFFPAVKESLKIALALDCWRNFGAYSDLRNTVEAGFWHQAVEKLTEDDKQELQNLIEMAWDKLRSHPVQIPHREHRELHLRIYSRLENPFVLGILEAYWLAYERVGLNLFTDYDYLEKVWAYHQRMVESICSGDFDDGYDALVEHKDLLLHRASAGR
jgi:DNA-binding FadR family transcriptional regulator